MKIVSTFLFSEPYEKDVLLCKFNSEYDCVDEFIGIESAYDFRMHYKGLFLKEILKEDQFKPFLDKITVLSSEKSLYPMDAPYDEQNNLLCEFNSRGYCWDYIRAKYSDEDWLIMEDADEMLDFSDSRRRDILLNEFKTAKDGIQFFNTRYWWDYDNIAIYEKYIPCHKIGALKEREHPFYHRNQLCRQVKPPLICGFEYSHCFPKNGNWKKVNSASHDKYQVETMDMAYKYNTWHKEPKRGERLQLPFDFFETIELTPNNSPRFVLENLKDLRVNTIDPNYAEHRKTQLNIAPHPCLQYNVLGGNKIRDDRNFYKR